MGLAVFFSREMRGWNAGEGWEISDRLEVKIFESSIWGFLGFSEV